MDFEHGLSDRRAAFCEAYVENKGKGTDALKQAGYETDYPAAGAYKLLQEPKVKAYINYLKEKRKYDAEIRKDDLIEELKSIAFSNLAEFVNIERLEDYIINGEKVQTIVNNKVVYKSFDQIPEPAKKALKGISESISKNGHSIRLDTHDKIGAIRLLLEVVKGADPVPKSPDVNVNVNFDKGSISLKRRKRKDKEDES